MSTGRRPVRIDRIQQMIYLIGGRKVMLDSDLAALYGVQTKLLNRAVKRNADRFPHDFAFQLTGKESEALRCQFGTSNMASKGAGRGGRRYLPYVFTEHGAIMAAMVLNSPRAVEMSVHVVRAFVRLRELLASNRELADKLAEMERKVESHDAAIRNLFEAIRHLLASPESPRKQIGFHIRERTSRYQVR